MTKNPKQEIVRWYGRWCFLVLSDSRPGLLHLVDLEPELDDEGNPAQGGEPYKCSCEAHFYHVTRPCKHVKAVLRFIKPLFAFFKTFPGATKPATSHETKSQPRQYRLDPNKTHHGIDPKNHRRAA